MKRLRSRPTRPSGDSLASRHAPERAQDVPLCPETVARLRAWLSDEARAKTVAYVSAAAGAGLSTLLRLLAAECGLDTVWGCAADGSDRTLLARAGASKVSLTFARKVLIMDELDGIQPACAVEVGAFARSKTRHAPLVLLDHTGSRQRRSRLASGLVCGQRAVAEAFEFSFQPERLLRVVERIAAAEEMEGGATHASRIAAANGDLRQAINSLESFDPAAAMRYSRDALESLDWLLGPVPSRRTVIGAIRAYDDDPSLANVFQESYLIATHPPSLETIAGLADSFSAGDVAETICFAKQDFSMPATQMHAALTCAAPTLMLPPRNGRSCTRFGTTWSKTFNQAARQGVLRQISTARRERGLSDLGATDFAILAMALGSAIREEDAEGLHALSHGLNVQQIQSCMRWMSCKVPTIAAISKLVLKKRR